MPFWEPRAASLVVTGGGPSVEIPCFPLPLAAPTAGIEGPLLAFDAADPKRVAGAIALYDAPRMRVPHAWYAGVATWTYDPANTFDGSSQVLPFAREIQDAMQPSIDAGATRVRRSAQRGPCRLEGLLRPV